MARTGGLMKSRIKYARTKCTSDPKAKNFTDGWKAKSTICIDIAFEEWLSRADSMLGELISKVINVEFPRRFAPSNASSHFDAIARSIVYQQLSKNAAATIYGRFVSVLGGAPTPDRVLASHANSLRSAGLSKPKVRYITALAEAVKSGELNLRSIGRLPDDAIIEELTKVPGIGVWTAQMFLMFRLQRSDVLPVNDLGIQKGLQIAHGLKEPASPDYVKNAGACWTPYRSIACLYLWAAVDLKIND